MSENHQSYVSFIWSIANLLRGPYRPPQYRRVMLPLTVLRRLDSVLEPTKEAVIAKLKAIEGKDHKPDAIERILKKEAGLDFYNTSPMTFKKMVDAPDNMAADLKNYIQSFSANAREIIEKFGFEQQIDRLNDSNRLFLVMKEFAKMDLSPTTVSNHEMGKIFEELVRKFNEQSNEEAGDHFTPREVIKLMAHVLYGYDAEFYRTPGLRVKIYDPACGTGGMLSESQHYIEEQVKDLNIDLYGQDYNGEAWAICSADMLIKGENPHRIVLGNTFGDGKTGDGHPNEKFHYMLANPPFGVEWKPEEEFVKKEHETLGFAGRFGPGLPRINDGSLLFLLHMISKMEKPPKATTENGERQTTDDSRGARIAIVFNGSPLFTGDAGSGESNIRRWVIENDWLETIIALPDQMFYNTGIFTYVWIVTNRKSNERKGKIQLINGVNFYQKMRKSLGNKRNEITAEQINKLTKIYGAFTEGESCKIFDNRAFGYLKMTVERPLRLNFQASQERIERLKDEPAFQKLAESKKRKDAESAKTEIEAGQKQQHAILNALATLDSNKLYRSRPAFALDVNVALQKARLKTDAALLKAILNALSERDPEAEICKDSKGRPEPDSDLRDTENIPLPAEIALPLPLAYDDKADKSALIGLVKDHCETYMQAEVLPHVPDAWIDYDKTKAGYEIPFNRHFYQYVPPRPLSEIETDIKRIEQEILTLLAEVTG